MHCIDITGNWFEGDRHLATVQVAEPAIKPGETRAFSQLLKLPAGRFLLRFLCEPAFDNVADDALRGSGRAFGSLKVDGRNVPLQFVGVADAGSDGQSASVLNYRGETSIDVPVGHVVTRVELSWHGTRPPRTWVCSPRPFSTDTRFFAPSPLNQDSELLSAHDLPFNIRKLDAVHYTAYGDFIRSPDSYPDRFPLLPWWDGMHLEFEPVPVLRAHFLGMIHLYDIANGSWYSPKGDHGYSHFVGDQAGEIEIQFADSTKLNVPLIFGFNLWFGRPWDLLWFDIPGTPTEPRSNWESTHGDDLGSNWNGSLFVGRERYRDDVRQSLRLVDGVRLPGSRSTNGRFIFSVDLSGRDVRSVTVRGSDEMHGYPIVSALTLEVPHNSTVSDRRGLVSLPNLGPGNEDINAISMEEIENSAFRPAVDKLRRLLYTHREDIPLLARPERPSGYVGPTYDFQGTQQAIYAATYLYHNGPECAAHIADEGTGCSSSTARRAMFSYTLGWGAWHTVTPLYDGLADWFDAYEHRSPGENPGSGDASGGGSDPNVWSRGAGSLLREAVAFGFDKFVDKYIEWLDSRLFMDGKPPHWIRVPGNPTYARQVRQVIDQVEEGNRENDGHGICMWARALVWHWLGRPREWNERHFDATEAAVDWIQWQLDTDVVFPGLRRDVLFTESECAHSDYDIYSSYNCLHGLKLSIRMAQQLGRGDLVERWTNLHTRLRKGILDHLVDDTPEGPVWHTSPRCDWQDHAHKLVHLALAPDGDTYTPLQDYALGDHEAPLYLEISKNTYRVLMKDKNYDCLRMYGYGQGMMSQGALLLDEMEDAEQFVNMMVTHSYLPNLEGWLGPEGIIVHRSGEYYVPVNGYTGQDSHVADSTKALRLMLGIDDNDASHLRLVPRFPSSWNHIEIESLPALFGEARGFIGYSYERAERRHTFRYRCEQPVGRLSVRLGPFPMNATLVEARRNGQPVPGELTVSGDSQWMWFREMQGQTSVISIQYDL